MKRKYKWNKIYIKNLLKCIIFILKQIWNIIRLILYIVLIWFILWWLSLTPSLNKEWQNTEKIPIDIRFPNISLWDNPDIITINNIRNFSHNSLTEYNIDYYNKEINLNKINSLYYIVEPFSNIKWPAHTMLSFWFTDWTYLTISAELRKEKWESFNPLLWILNQYELIYIIWDESDLIKLRANIRKDDVILYPINIESKEIKDLFTSMLYRADKLTKEPEFYNTIWNTCTTNILSHVNSIKKEDISYFNYKILLPAFSDEIAYELWLINTLLSLEEARKYYNINNLSNKYKNDKEYSKKIRAEIK